MTPPISLDLPSAEPAEAPLPETAPKVGAVAEGVDGGEASPNLIPFCLASSAQNPVWWGKFSLENCKARSWRVGPLQLWVQALPSELRVATRLETDPMLFDDFLNPLPTAEEPDAGADVRRFGLQGSPRYVTLYPALADRPVVARPDIPLTLPPGRQLTIYISTPLWVRLEADEPPEVLMDHPTFRPSDTWFGPSTVRGELCYASRTQAHIDLAELIKRPHRAISAVTIHNRASDLLTLKRIKLPTAHLSLFVDTSGFLWTQSLTLERESATENDLAFMHLAATSPPEAGETQRVAPPREPDRGRFVRALQAFLS
jgi:hypothetical protein